MKTPSNLLALASLALFASCSRENPSEGPAALPHPDTATNAGMEVTQAVQQVGSKQAPLSQSILGTWLIDQEHSDRKHSGSLGASELFMKDARAASSIYTEQTLVISTNTVTHRYRNLGTAKLQISNQQGKLFPVVKDTGGVEYLAIEYSYTLNTNVTPSEIDFHWTGPAEDWSGKSHDGSSKGVYKIENDVLWLALSSDENRTRPQDFEDHRDTRLYKATRSK